MPTPRQETKRRRMPHPRLQFGTQGPLSLPNVQNRTKLLPHRLVQNELWLARVHFKVLDRGLELARRSPVLGITIARSTYRHLLVLESDKSLHASGSVTRGSALVGC